MQENSSQNVNCSTKFAIGGIYSELPRAEKKMVAARLSKLCTGTSSTWMKRLEAWAGGKDFPCNELVLKKAYAIIGKKA